MDIIWIQANHANVSSPLQAYQGLYKKNKQYMLNKHQTIELEC